MNVKTRVCPFGATRISVLSTMVDPLGRGRDAERGAVAGAPVEAAATPRGEQIRVVVADGHGGDVPVHVEQHVAVHVDACSCPGCCARPGRSGSAARPGSDGGGRGAPRTQAPGWRCASRRAQGSPGMGGGDVGPGVHGRTPMQRGGGASRRSVGPRPPNAHNDRFRRGRVALLGDAAERHQHVGLGEVGRDVAAGARRIARRGTRAPTLPVGDARDRSTSCRPARGRARPCRRRCMNTTRRPPRTPR